MPRSLKTKIKDASTLEQRERIAVQWISDWNMRIQTDFADIQARAKQGHLDTALRHLHYTHQDMFKGLEALRGFLPFFGLDAQRVLYDWIGASNRMSKRIEGLLSDGDIPQAIDELKEFAKYFNEQQLNLLKLLHSTDSRS